MNRPRKVIELSVTKLGNKTLMGTADSVADHPGSLGTVYRLPNVRVRTVYLIFPSGSKFDSNGTPITE